MEDRRNGMLECWKTPAYWQAGRLAEVGMLEAGFWILGFGICMLGANVYCLDT